MNRLLNLCCIVGVAGIFVLSCSKKSNSRNGEEESEITTTTTSGPAGPSGTTGGTTSSGQATGTITGSPSCTLNPMQVISSNFISSMTLNTAGDFQGTSSYDMYNFNSFYYVHLYFNSTMPPATGGYSVIAGHPPVNYPNLHEVAIGISPNGGGSYDGYGQSGVVYVTNTGTLVTAVFCNVPVKFESGANTYTSVVSARIEK
jgi:hypothetical protein